MKKRWTPPSDLDPECLALCVAINKLPGIQTTCSCCGHGKHGYWIFFRAKSIAKLPRLLYWFDSCHTGCSGWKVTVTTDCGMSPATFCVEGPAGPQGYRDAEHIAKFIEADVKRKENK